VRGGVFLRSGLASDRKLFTIVILGAEISVIWRHRAGMKRGDL
jgi:hypothetical protein